MDIDEIRRKKMEELQRRIMTGEEQVHAQQMEEQIREMERVARTVLDDKAYERLNNIKLVNEELTVNVLVLLYQLYASGKIRRKIDDKAFKGLLNRIVPNKRETRIIRK